MVPNGGLRLRDCLDSDNEFPDWTLFVNDDFCAGDLHL